MLIARFPLNGNLNNVVDDKYYLYSGSNSWSTGFTSGSSLTLNGQQAYMDNPFCNLSEWTLSFYVKDNGTGDWSDIFTFSDSYERIEIHNQGASWTWYSNNTTNSNIINSGTNLASGFSRNVWHHVAIIYDNEAVKLYIDGQIKINRRPSRNFNSNVSRLYFGSRINGSYANINIQDIRCYSHALSNIELRNLLRYPVIHYSFEQIYQPLDFIEFTGSQFIDSGITELIKPFKVEITYKKTNSDTSDQCLFGQRQFGKFPNIYNNYYETIFGNTASNTAVNDDYKHTLISDSESGFYKDGTNIYSGTSSSRSSSYSALIGAFSESDSSGAKWYFKGKLYGIKIWSNNELYRDFIPCLNTMTRATGLYDKVTNTFYSSNAALVAYKRIQAIKSNGTQTIDTRLSYSAYSFEQDIYFVNNGSRQLMGGNGNQGTYWGMNTSGYLEMEGATSITGYTRHIVKYTAGSTLVVDGTTAKTSAHTAATANYTLFNLSAGGYPCTAVLYYLKVYSGSILVRYFIPVVRTSDGKPGLYELITDEFYTNSSGNNFTPYEFTISTSTSQILDYNRNNDATSSACNLTTDCVKGIYSLDTTTNNGYLTLPNLYLNSKFTISCWVKFINHSSWARVFDFGTAQSGSDYGIGIATSDTNGTLYVFGRSGGGASLPDTIVATVGLNTWYHMAVTIDGTSAKFYLNGQLTSSFTITNSIGGRVYSYNYIAKSNWSADGYSRKYISDFRIYNNALSADDIKEIYDSITFIDSKCNLYCSTTSSDSNVSITPKDIVKSYIISQGNNSAIIAGRYIPVEYIESTGTQWFDSGVSITAKTEVQAKIKFNAAFNYNMMYGAWNIFSMSLKGDNTWCVASGGTSTQNIGLSSSTDIIYDIKHTPAYLQLNSTQGLLGTGSNTVDSRHILMFAASNSGNTPYAWESFGRGRIYRFKIYQEGTLVRDFIPVLKAEGLVPGMFDLANGVFYSNEGTGTFSYGMSYNKLTALKCNNLYADAGVNVANTNENWI